MSGSHEPPSNRSFYFSLATSTLRFVIIVALVVGGVVLINQGFQGHGTSLPGGGPTPASPSVSPTPTKPRKPQPSPQIVGVRIGVFNGTGVTGLAATTAATLEKKYGYVPAQIADAPSPVTQTTLYYRTASDKVEADALAANFFKGLDVKISKLPTDATNVQKNVQVAVYLGNDYATKQQG